ARGGDTSPLCDHQRVADLRVRSRRRCRASGPELGAGSCHCSALSLIRCRSPGAAQDSAHQYRPLIAGAQRPPMRSWRPSDLILSALLAMAALAVTVGVLELLRQ